MIEPTPMTAEQAVRKHFDDVLSGDSLVTAAGYSHDAELHRAGDTLLGRPSIEAYFRTLPARLDGAIPVLDELTADGDTVTIRWHLEGGVEASGTDVLTIRDGLIVLQVVDLDAAHF